MLTKQNPVSLDQNIAYVLTKESPKTVALYVNNVIYTDDKDISWLYDVAFERAGGPGGLCGLLGQPVPTIWPCGWNWPALTGIT